MMGKRRELTAEEAGMVDHTMAASYDRIDELTPFQQQFTDSTLARIGQYESKTWFSDRELEIITQIAERLEL